MRSETVLETKDLTLEPLLAAHAAALFGGLRDARIYEYIPQSPPATVTELEAQFLRLRSGRSPDSQEVWLNWAVRDKDGAYVGWVQATVHRDRSVEFAYIVFPTLWGKGYAGQACQRMLGYLRDEYSVTTAYASVDTENLASIRVLEKLGFVRVGTKKANDMVDRLEHRYEKRW